MKPIEFAQATKTLNAPTSLAGRCGGLPVWSDSEQCVSCWKPSIKDRFKILFGGNIYLGVLSGKTQPPVFLTADEMFYKPSVKERMSDFISACGRFIGTLCKSVWNALKQADKRKHFVCGFLLSFLVGIIVPLLGLVIGCVAGAFKELRDSRGYGTVELMDFICTCIGALVALPFSYIVHALIW